jgi:hypothetical protein
MQQKEMTPPQRDVADETSDKRPESREGWNAEKLDREASNMEGEDIHQQMNRGDESKDDPDERDTIGAQPSINTPHGREEAKNDEPGAANQNG